MTAEERAYRQRPEVAAGYRARTAAWKHRNREKIRAYQQIYNKRHWAERGAELRPVNAAYKRRYRARRRAAARLYAADQIRAAWWDEGRVAC